MSIDDKLDELLYESVIDQRHGQLSRHVWHQDTGKDDQGPTLLPTVRYKIMRGWSKMNDVAMTGAVLIVGGIATYNYSDESDIDVTIQLLNPTQEELKNAQAMAKEMSGQEKAGPHEINYFARPDIDYSRYNAVYDVIHDGWSSPPSEAGVNIEGYLDAFREVVENIDIQKAEMIRDLIDIKHFESFGAEDQAKAKGLVDGKIKEIETSIDELSETYQDIKTKRKEAFEAGPQELGEYQHANELPDNVIYLLLRRYCYINFLAEMQKVATDGVEATELPQVGGAIDKMQDCYDM
jgi:hypothetical protein